MCGSAWQKYDNEGDVLNAKSILAFGDFEKESVFAGVSSLAVAHFLPTLTEYTPFGRGKGWFGRFNFATSCVSR